MTQTPATYTTSRRVIRRLSNVTAELAKTCNFCNNDCSQRALRDQIIEGLQDGEIIQELLQVKDLTLNQTISRCRGLEAAKQPQKHIQGTPEVNIVRSRRYMSNTGPCAGYGGDPHDGGRKKCPAYNQVCRSCDKMGHFSRVCRQKPAGTVHQRGATRQTNALSTRLPSVTCHSLDCQT